MSHIQRWLLAGLVGLVGLAACTEQRAAAQPQPNQPRPNVLLIFVDDLGYGELGCQGNPQIPTPHIDSLAAAGVRMTAGYVTASFCSPSRAGLLTGRYQTRFGSELNPTGRNNADPRAGLPPNELTLARLLKDAGYATALVGKWHLGDSPGRRPLDHGFDEFYGFLHEGRFFKPPPYDGLLSFLRRRELPADAVDGRWREGNIIWSNHLPTNEPPYDEGNPLWRGAQAIDEPEHLTDALAREALDFIERRRAEPWFLYLSYNAVHSPLQGDERYLARFAHIDDLQRRIFAAMLAQLDDSIGRVLAGLRRLELEERTLVFFVSDNGGPTRELTSSNAPLRGGKGELYEGGVRVPFLVRWPGVLPAGKVETRAVSTIDIVPTALAAAGAPLPADRPFDGVDLTPYLRGVRAAPPHPALYWRMGDRFALRSGPWKLVGRRRGAGLAPAVELYHLDEDLAEADDRAAREPAVLARLLTEWRLLDSEMVEPNWRPGR